MLSSQLSTRDPLTTALIREARNGEAGGNVGKVVAEGQGWRVLDIECTAGPQDRPFEERHAWASISPVFAGIFSYRSDRGSEIALDVGFDDLSNFVRSFRAEFGISPRQYRINMSQRGGLL